MLNKELTYTVGWNIFLITAGSLLFSIGVNGVVVHHEFITGGIFGLALIAKYSMGMLSPAAWYLLFNIPLFILGWFGVSRRFVLYSGYSVLVVTLATQFIKLDFGFHEQIYAAIAGGVICGTGSGIILRSLGSGGGLDVVAVLLNNKYNIGVGKTSMAFNAILFSLSALEIGADAVIASMVLVFISAVTMENVLSLFSQRKMAYIISDKNEEIAREVLEKLKRGATIIPSRGAYTKNNRDMLMTVINNIQLKRLEEIVFTIDENAMFIVENTFNVLGRGFSRRKKY